MTFTIVLLVVLVLTLAVAAFLGYTAIKGNDERTMRLQERHDEAREEAQENAVRLSAAVELLGGVNQKEQDALNITHQAKKYAEVLQNWRDTLLSDIGTLGRIAGLQLLLGGARQSSLDDHITSSFRLVSPEVRRAVIDGFFSALEPLEVSPEDYRPYGDRTATQLKKTDKTIQDIWAVVQSAPVKVSDTPSAHEPSVAIAVTDQPVSGQYDMVGGGGQTTALQGAFSGQPDLR